MCGWDALSLILFGGVGGFCLGMLFEAARRS